MVGSNQGLEQVDIGHYASYPLDFEHWFLKNRSVALKKNTFYCWVPDFPIFTYLYTTWHMGDG